MKALTLSKEAAVLTPDLSIKPVVIGPGFYETLNERFNQFAGHTLISSHDFEEDWPVWERHPKGDELVMLLLGEVTMVIRGENGNTAVDLTQAGTYVIVPRNTWHTAKTKGLARMLFFTPGEGTDHEPV